MEEADVDFVVVVAVVVVRRTPFFSHWVEVGQSRVYGTKQVHLKPELAKLHSLWD